MKHLDISGRFIARNTLLNIVGQALPLLVGITIIPFIVKGLGMERFGILSLLWTLMAYFSMFDFGLGRSMTKFVAEIVSKEEIQKLPPLVWTLLTFHFFLGTLGALILIAITSFLVDNVFNIPINLVNEAKGMFYFLSGSVPLVVSMAALRGVLEAGQRFDLINAVKIFLNSSFFLIPAAAVVLELHLPSISAFFLLANLVAVSIYLILCMKVYPVLKSGYMLDMTAIRKIFSFSSWVAVFNLLSSTMLSMDRVLIGYLLTITAVSYYTVPYELVSRLSILPASLSTVLFPAFSSVGLARKEELSFLYANAVKYLSIVMGIVVFFIILLAPKILDLWMGGNFLQNSKLVLQILAIGMFANSLAWIPFSLLQALGRPDIPSKIRLVEFPIYAGVAWIFISKWGIVGAAISWTLWLWIDAFFLFLYAWKLVPNIYCGYTTFS